MADSDTVIAVNGQNGNDLSTPQSGDRRIDGALVRYTAARSKNGDHGDDALPSRPGGPGGSLTVELSESSETEGSIHVATLRYEGTKQPVTSAESRSWRTILLSAAGGDGENGRTGGDGQSGLDGDQGRGATANADAGDGRHGGNGGNAGRGSDGGDGGAGGAIQILLGANNTHLLHAVKWNVSGGEGGRPGQHGTVGRGGKPGAEGPGHEWKQSLGYRYYCTPDCLGRNTENSSALVRAASTVRRADDRLADRYRTLMGPQLVQGNTLQNTMMTVARQYHATARRPAGVGICHCAGGNDSCLGCEYREMTSMFRRIPGQPGKNGADGQSQSEPLQSGVPGEPGQVTIVVQNLDGTTSDYAEPWRLRLRSFDLEDENHDGVFEPGEKVLVRRICVENFGGMPSPMQGTELSINSSEHIEPDSDVKLFLPASIAPNSTVTVEGYLSARIKPLSNITPGISFTKTAKVSMAAILPWVKRKLEHFDMERTFNIQSPCTISSVRVSPSFSPGSSGKIVWDISNRGNTAIGSATSDARHVEVVVSVPLEYGNFNSDNSTQTKYTDEVAVDMDDIQPRAKSTSSHGLTILPDVKAPTRFEIELSLYASDPAQTYTEDDDRELELVLLQTLRVPVHVSEGYHDYSATADILLVVNSATPPDRVTALQDFIRDELDMTVDCWDVNLYGGLQFNEKTHIFSKYDGKTIILLGDLFPTRDSTNAVITDLCDPTQVRRSLNSRTSFLALGLQGKRSCQDSIRQAVFDVQSLHADTVSSIPRSARFATVDALATAIMQSKLNGDVVSAVFLLTGKRLHRHDVLNQSPDRQAEAASRKLRGRLPQARFLISPVQRDADASKARGISDEMIVLLGANRNAQLQATERQYAINVDLFEKYSIISALPPIQRAERIYSDTTGHNGRPSFITEAAICSLSIDCVKEIDNFTFAVFGSGTPKMPKPDSREAQDFLRIHFATMTAVLSHPGHPTQAVVDVLLYCLAACEPQNTRQKLAGGMTSRQKLGTFLEKTFSAHLGRDISKQPENVRLDTLTARAAKLTRMSEHAFTRSRETSMDVVPGSQVCTAEAWGQMYREIEGKRRAIEEAERRVRGERGGVGNVVEVFSC